MTDQKQPKDRAARIRADARGQFAKGEAAPNPDGRISAKPTVLGNDGDATFDHTGEVERRAHGGKAATVWGDRMPSGSTPPKR